MKKTLVKLSAVGSVVSLAILPFVTHAAADPALVNAGEVSSGAVKDAFIAHFNATNIGIAVGAVAAMWILGWIMKKVFGRRR